MVEMVTPDGEHVRFGPTQWILDSNFIYPQTTKVSGVCNENPFVDNRNEWKWKPCKNNQYFEHLWKAVRGSGKFLLSCTSSIKN